MSDEQLPMNPDGSLMALEEDEQVETWLNFLRNSNYDWAECQLVYDDDNLVLRVRWADGEEQAFHCALLRRMRLVAPKDERENN
jgi:hypothetical protein